MLFSNLRRSAPVWSSVFALVMASVLAQAGCEETKSGGGGDDDDTSGGAGGESSQGGSGSGGEGDPCGDGICSIVEDTCSCVDCLDEPLCQGTGGSGQGGSGQGGFGQGGSGQGGFGQGGFGQGGSGQGGGGPLACSDDVGEPCTDPTAGNCICAGCSGMCVDAQNNPVDDCVCPSCANDAYCSNSQNCQNDGTCDPYNEGCVCADCAAHPQCP